MAVVSELVSKFSFIGSLAPQKDFNSNLKMSVGLLAGVGAGLTAAAGGFFTWVGSVLNTIDPLAQLNRETGVAVEQIQALGYAASVNGSSADALGGSFKEMSKRLGEFVQTGGGPAKEIIEKLGISVKDAEGNVRSADQVFLGLSDTLQGMGRAEQANVLDKLGIDQSLIQLVSLSSEEVGKLTDKALALGVVTKEQADNAAAFNDSLTTLKFGLSGIQNAVAVGFAPAMTDLTDKFVDFLVANQDLIRDGLTWLGEVLTSVMGFIERIGPIVLVAAAAFVAWQLATGGLVAIMGVLLSPVVLITAGIIALLLIVDDLIVAFNGGQSVIRDFFLEFAGIDIVPILQGIVDAFKWMIDAATALLEPWLAFIGGIFSAVISVFKGDFTGALDELGVAFQAYGDFVFGIFEAVIGGITALWSGMFSFVKNAALSMLPQWAIDLIGGGGDASPTAVIGAQAATPMPQQAMTAMPMPQQAMTAMPAMPGSMTPNDAAAMTPNDAVVMGSPITNSSTSNSIEQQVQINVSSNEPKAAGAAVNDALQEQLRNAKTQVNRGGR
jgi:TP901 family phage tail tape measure protein